MSTPRKVITSVKGNTENITPHFQMREYDCPCKVCVTTFIDQELAEKLEALRMRVGVPIRITSGYRCDYHQRELKERGLETSKGRSQHQDGMAADIWTGVHSGMYLERHAKAVGFKAIGVAQTWIHVDLRPKVIRWGYRG